MFCSFYVACVCAFLPSHTTALFPPTASIGMMVTLLLKGVRKRGRETKLGAFPTTTPAPFLLKGGRRFAPTLMVCVNMMTFGSLLVGMNNYSSLMLPGGIRVYYVVRVPGACLVYAVTLTGGGRALKGLHTIMVYSPLSPHTTLHILPLGDGMSPFPREERQIVAGGWLVDAVVAAFVF